MTYQPTILNVSTVIFLVGVITYTVWNYEILSAGEGWGIVAMIGLIGMGLIAGIADFAIQKFIKNRTIVNVIGLTIIVGFTIAILSDL